MRQTIAQQQANLDLMREEMREMRYGRESGSGLIETSPESTVLMRIRMAETELLTGRAFAPASYSMGAKESGVVLTERMAELELALEDRNWLRLSAETSREFSRQGLRAIQMLSRLFYLKNPLINRGVEIKALYVWGQGVSIAAKDDEVNEVIQAFMDDPRNRSEMWGHQARRLKEVELEVTGNLFFLFFIDRVSTGKVTMRTIPADEIQHIHTNPDDFKEPWFYERLFTPAGIDPTSGAPVVFPQKRILYPDWRYAPGKTDARIKPFVGMEIHWDEPVYHVKVGSLPDMRFGTPETYCALDWARAYKEFLEDWASITRSYSRFSWKLTTKGGQGAVDAMKTKLGTTAATGSMTMIDSNPPPTVGSTFISTEGVKMDPISTRGAQVSIHDGAPLGRMVASGVGIPETMLMEDIAKGSHATAKTLDRPTELLMRDRQELWIDVITDILNFVIDWSARAPNGKLKGKIAVDTLVDSPIKGNKVVVSKDVIDRHIDVDFPPVLQQDVKERIDAIVGAVTLGGYQAAGTIPDMRYVCGMLLRALGENEIDELLDTFFPAGAEKPTQEGQRLLDAVEKLCAAVSQIPAQTSEAVPEPVAPPAQAPPPVVVNVAEREDKGGVALAATLDRLASAFKQQRVRKTIERDGEGRAIAVVEEPISGE